MNWFSGKTRRAEQARQQLEATQEKHAAQYDAEGVVIQEELRSKLLPIIQELHPDLDEDATLVAYATYCLLIGDSPDRLPDDGITDEEIKRSGELAAAILKEPSDLRDVALRGAHTAALYWLARGIDVASLSPDSHALGLAEQYIDHAIIYAEDEAQATYLSTAAQINMTWGRYPQALDFATLAVELAPNNPEAVRMKGMAAFANGDLLSAKQLLERAQELFPGLEGIAEPLRAIKAQL